MSTQALRLQSYYNDQVINAMEALIIDRQYRLSNCAKEVNCLFGGTYFGREYLDALKWTGQTEVWTYHERESSLTIGILPFQAGWAIEKLLYSDGKKVILPFHYRIGGKGIEGISPSEALETLKIGPTFLGNGEALVLCELVALRILLNVNKFNTLFDPSGTTPLRIVFDSLDFGSMSHLLQWERIEDPETIERGKIIRFQMNKEGTLRNTEFPYISLGNGRFLGFNTSHKGFSIQEIVLSFLPHDVSIAAHGLSIHSERITELLNSDSQAALNAFTMWSKERFSEWLNLNEQQETPTELADPSLSNLL